LDLESLESDRHERGVDMSLIGLVLTLVIVGVLLWLINNYVPMDSKIKTIVNVVVVVVVVIWLLQAFGILGSLRDIRIR
jgi:Flp pilus assembly protein TadB